MGGVFFNHAPLGEEAKEGTQGLDAAVDGSRALVFVVDKRLPEGCQFGRVHARERDGPVVEDPDKPPSENVEITEVGPNGGRCEVLTSQVGLEPIDQFLVAVKVGSSYYTHKNLAVSGCGLDV